MEADTDIKELQEELWVTKNALAESEKELERLREETANQIEILEEERLKLIVKVARLEKEADRLWRENEQLRAEVEFWNILAKEMAERGRVDGASV